MPTILRFKGYRVGFFSADGDEPPHVHVTKAGSTAKFWMEPVELANNFGFTRHELHEIHDVLQQHASNILNAWHEYFG
jgi:hypothetical protein